MVGIQGENGLENFAGNPAADAQLDDTSTNAVQNKVVKAAIDEVKSDLSDLEGNKIPSYTMLHNTDVPYTFPSDGYVANIGSGIQGSFKGSDELVTIHVYPGIVFVKKGMVLTAAPATGTNTLYFAPISD